MSEQQSSPSMLPRELGLVDAVAIVVGTTVGSAIFLVPGSIAMQLTSPVMVLLVWLIGGILSLCGALSLAELGIRYPGAGGLYVYLKELYGRLPGFLYGWSLLSMIHSGSIAALALAFGVYSAQLFSLKAVGQKAVALSCILLLTTLNSCGVRVGKQVQNILALTKTGGILAMTLTLFLFGSRVAGVKDLAPTTSDQRPLIVSFEIALIAVLWAYEGWHVISFAAGELTNPRKSLPLALGCGTAFITLIYVSANLSYYHVLSPGEIRSSPAVAATAMSRCLRGSGSILISVLILISVCGALNGLILTGPRVYFAMARDGLFWSGLGKTDSR